MRIPLPQRGGTAIIPLWVQVVNPHRFFRGA